MGRELIADRRANEIRAVRIKALLHQQVDMAEVDVAEIDSDLLGVARPVAELVSIWLDGIWMVPRWFSRAATKEHESSR